MNTSDLQFYILNGSTNPIEFKEVYMETYRTWQLVWKQTFMELDGVSQLYSDGFTRQSKIGSLIYKGKCIALVAFRECDFSDQVHRDDSLLSSWTDSAFTKLLKSGSRVSICSYLSVHPEFRGKMDNGFTFKQLISYLATLSFLDSDCDVMTGTMRKNRGTDKSAYACGASFLESSEMHKVEVDLVGFFKEEIQKNRSDYFSELAETLYSNRRDAFAINRILKVA